MSKHVKISLNKCHRPHIERMALSTGLSHNQIINTLWVRGAKILDELEKAHLACPAMRGPK